MKTLIIVNNDLKNDTRVKRHIAAIAECAENVQVLSRPIPDFETSMYNEKINYNFFEYAAREYPITVQLRESLNKWGILDQIKECFSLIMSDNYYDPSIIEVYQQKLSEEVKRRGFMEIYNRVNEPMEDSKALSYLLFFMEKSVQFAECASKIEADVVVCNDIDTLLCGVVHKLIWNSRLVYDMHDIYEDNAPGTFPHMYRKMLALFNDTFIKYTDIVMGISVSEMIWVKNNYKVSCPCIPMLNCSATMPIKGKQKDFGGEKLKIYYHGISHKSRGLWEIMEAVLSFKEFELVLRCLPSENLEQIKQWVIENGYTEKVHFLAPVEPDEIAEAAHSAGDIGIHMVQSDKCLNWQFALTNKFIEYSKAGLPIITSYTQEQGRLVKKYRNGFILKENDVESIKKALKMVLSKRKRLRSYAEGSIKLAETEFDWNKYKLILQAIILNNQKVIEENKITR